MTRTIKLVLPDDVRVPLTRVAEKAGQSLEDWILERIRSYVPKAALLEPGDADAMERLMRHAGAVHLGYPTGADNEGIDADLTCEYASAHEEA
jgi:hypothetical protein